MITAVGGGDDASVHGYLRRRRRVLALCPGRLPAAAVVLGQPLPAAPLGLVELRQHVKPSHCTIQFDMISMYKHVHLHIVHVCVCVLLVATYALQKMNTQKHWTLNLVH